MEAGASAGSRLRFGFLLNRLLHLGIHNVHLMKFAFWFFLGAFKNGATLRFLLLGSLHGDPSDLSVSDLKHVVVEIFDCFIVFRNECLAIFNRLGDQRICLLSSLLRSSDHSGRFIVLFDDSVPELCLVGFSLFSLLPLIEFKSALEDSLPLLRLRIITSAVDFLVHVIVRSIVHHVADNGRHVW